MKVFKIASVSLLSVLMVVLSACSSRADTLPQDETQFVGILGGSGGNLTLNGQRLDVSNATITLDGEPATALVLQPGMELEVRGRSSDASFSADSVDANTRVKGQVDVVSTSSLEVVGVKVNTDSNTLVVDRARDGTFTTISLTDIQPNDYLEVYGVPRNDDSVLATRIMRKVEDTVNKVELRLKIRDVDTAAKTFTYGLGTHTVNFASAELRGNLADGAVLRIKGTRDGLTINAERVRTGDRGDDDSDDSRPGKIELEGIISNLDTAAQTFTILEFAVDYSNAEVKGNLSEGSWVEVEGRIDSETSVIVAREVKLEGKWDDSDDNGGDDDSGSGDGDDDGGNDSEQEVTATVSSFDAATNSFMLGSTKVTVQSSTEYKNAANDTISSSEFWGIDRTLSLVKVEGVKQADTLIARQVKLR
jgi:hypothetical protein